MDRPHYVCGASSPVGATCSPSLKMVAGSQTLRDWTAAQSSAPLTHCYQPRVCKCVGDPAKLPPYPLSVALPGIGRSVCAAIDGTSSTPCFVVQTMVRRCCTVRARNCPGVIPVIRLNILVKCAWSEKPASCAISTRGVSVVAICVRACSTRS